MIYYVNANAPREGNGTQERPFRRIFAVCAKGAIPN